MLKTLSLIAVFTVCSFPAAIAWGQTVTPKTDLRPGTTSVSEPAPTPDEPAGRPVSPEAVAESKRLYKEGVKYGVAGLFSQAAELFRRSVQLNPDYADAHQGLGHAYLDLGRWDEAIQSLQQALLLNPKDKDARRRLDEAKRMLQKETNHNDDRLLAATPETPEATRALPRETAHSDDKSVAATPTPSAPLSIPATSSPESLSPGVSNTAESGSETLTKLYRIGPGDVLDVRLDMRPGEAPSTESTLFTITPSGFLTHPLLTAPLSVAGLTVQQIGALIEGDLKRRTLADNPKVTIEVRDYVSHAILVSGLVKDPGTKILRREAIPLYVVVADAQPLPEAARVSLVRNESNELYTIDLAKPGEMNLLVRPGDVITLQGNPTQFVYVSGEVKSPGEKTFRRGLTLTQAIIAAGGLTGKAREARLARDDGKGFLVSSRFKLKDIESGKQPDPLIEPGDRITIVD